MVPWWTVALAMFGAFSLGFMIAAILSAAGKDADTYNTGWDSRDATDTMLDMP